MRNCKNYSCMQTRNSECYNSECSFNVFPKNYLYGHAYTPNQKFKNTFMPEAGLMHGSIFPELVSPYVPGQSMDFINYLRNGGN